MDCKELKCSDTARDCRCYASIDTAKQTEVQFCGYKKNDLIIPCDAACCDGGCPGQCKGVFPRPPYGIDTNPIKVDEFPKYLIMAVFLIIVLLIVSTLTA